MLGRGGKSDPGTTTPAKSDPETTTPGKSDQVDTTPAKSELYKAARKGNLPLVKDLVASGGDVNYVNTSHYNTTPLLVAIGMRHHEVSEYLARLDSVKLIKVTFWVKISQNWETQNLPYFSKYPNTHVL